ncbi:S-adenosyl-methyltransferase MraW [Chlamydia ibidis]|uniref:Ribosomal RNA small subunit methyltransferase H n=2 Tax=Chlamydia ibidis TaxID=1405396 RepID=S7J4V8_9CHLA|nr:16S rRNA (cytosine(1402)-N(4))-methyltransferase RsmH [Chlamydia ibidis]EPP35082.1 S-adenosyl-methyltransferase MraW [Chlamydia ibidis]EQM62724.1 S-adenosyl-methyltransferase MraW [Chlamydia ibidis 10-1398/6]
MFENFPHTPVLVNECLSLFASCSLKTFRDVTVGAGGHAEAFLSSYPSILSYDASDRDLDALNLAHKRLERFGDRVHFRHASFQDLANDAPSCAYDGVLADLGISSMQIDTLERGFSFRGDDHVLDMRMDTTQGVTACEVLNTLREDELGKIFKEYGEEPLWKNAAKAIVQFRKHKRIITVRDLKEATQGVFPSYRLRKKIHPLTLIFQALRVHVNQEDLELKFLLDSAIQWLAPYGRLIIISFCSSEDRPVKWFFRNAEANRLGRVITKKVIVPSYEEIRRNPRSRSAKLRCFEKLPL